jgi:hypothetical protein
MTIDLFAGLPVNDYKAALTWYERLLYLAGNFPNGQARGPVRSLGPPMRVEA